MSKKIKALQTLGLIAGTTVAIGSLGVAGYAIADGAISLPTQAETPTVTPPQDVSTVVTDASITVSPVENAEYSLDGKTWQDSNIFLGLQPAQEYTVYIRIKATEDTPASEPTQVTVHTDKSVQAAPQINEPETTADSIIFEQIAGLEFSINNGETWQSENIFASLSPATEYTVLVRYAETATKYASDTISFQITTPKYEQEMPTEQTNSNYCEPTSITVGAIEGAEYSIDGIHYQDSNVFENLEVNTEYLFYIRYKETATHYASEPYTVYISTIKYSQSIPEISDAESTSPTSITMPVIAGVEYSIDGTQYSSNNVFTDLTPNEWYNIYARYAETATHYAGESVLISVQTQKYQQDAPVISLVEATTNSITVTELENCEYSINNGDTWQNSNVFTDLEDNTQYTILARYKETATHYQSSTANLVVSTQIMKVDQEAPVANDVGIKYFDGDTLEVNNKSGTNYEYAIAVWTNNIGETNAEVVTEWQTSPIFENVSSYFENLKNGKVLYRHPETSTQNASPTQNVVNRVSGSLSINNDNVLVVDGIWYTTIDESTVQVEGCSVTDGILSIPESITINDAEYSVVKINYICGSYALRPDYFLSEIKEIYVPKSVTSFRSDGGTFMGCNKLEKFYYNGSVTQVYHSNTYDFAGTGKDTIGGIEIIIGADVTAIPNDMFYTNSSNINFSINVKSVVFLAENKVTLNMTAFNYAKIPVFYVQDNLVEIYKSDVQLLNYQDKIKPLSEYVAE